MGYTWGQYLLYISCSLRSDPPITISIRIMWFPPMHILVSVISSHCCLNVKVQFLTCNKISAHHFMGCIISFLREDYRATKNGDQAPFFFLFCIIHSTYNNIFHFPYNKIILTRRLSHHSSYLLLKNCNIQRSQRFWNASINHNHSIH